MQKIVQMKKTYFDPDQPVQIVHADRRLGDTFFIYINSSPNDIFLCWSKSKGLILQTAK